MLSLTGDIIKVIIFGNQSYKLCIIKPIKNIKITPIKFINILLFIVSPINIMYNLCKKNKKVMRFIILSGIIIVGWSYENNY